MNETPILLVYFNRPAVLEANLRALSALRPKHLYLASDGPRSHNSDDQTLVSRCRAISEELVNWECAVHHLHSDSNRGCDVFVPMAVTWFFENVQEGIILDDDCIIDRNFYSFAARMLSEYRNDHTVMSVSSANVQCRKWGEGDYYFSRYTHTAGWATWRRAWLRFDPQMSHLESVLRKLPKILTSSSEIRFWSKFLRGLRTGRYPFWDAKWTYSLWAHEGWAISPNYNLVTNIGFGSDATHTTAIEAALAAPIQTISVPPLPPSGGRVVFPEAEQRWYEVRLRPTWRGRLSQARRRIVRWGQRFLTMVGASGQAQRSVGK